MAAVRAAIYRRDDSDSALMVDYESRPRRRV